MINLLKLFRRTKPQPEKRSMSLSDLRHMGTSNSLAGVTVNETTALNLSVVYACVNAISSDLSSISLNVYEDLPNGGKRKAKDHPLWRLLHTSPNEELTSDEFRFALISNTLRWGNGYAEIERARGGIPIALHLIPPQDVEVDRNKATGKLQYKIQGRGTLLPEDIIHIKCLGSPLGDVGLSPIKCASQAIGLGMAAETQGAAFYGNGARPGGIITFPESLSDEAIKNLRNSLTNVHGGPENFGKFLILEEGAKVDMLQIAQDEMQFLGTRTFQIEDICRWYRVPSSIVNENSHNTFSNSVEEGLRYVTHCLRPWAVRIEQHLNKKLFGEEDNHFCEHLLDSLMRGNPTERTSALKEQFLNGALTLNEWRELENRNPVEDPEQHFMQAQMKTLKQIIEGEPQPEPAPAQVDEPPQDEPAAEDEPSQEEEPQEEDNGEAVRSVIQDAVGRMIRREIKAIEKAAQHPNEFLKRLDEFYSSHEPFMAEAIAPALKLVNGDPEQLARLCCERHHNALLELSGQATAEELPSVVKNWCNYLSKEAEDIVHTLGA